MTVTEFSQILINTYSSNGAPKFRQILNTVSSLKWSTIPSMTAIPGYKDISINDVRFVRVPKCLVWSTTV